MDRKQRRAEARRRLADLRSRVAEDERKPWWSRSLSWLLVVKIIIEILILFMDSQDD